MSKYNDFRRIALTSKSYTCEGSLLTLTGYWCGTSVTIDLGAIDEEMFEQIVVEDEDEDEDEEE